MQRSVLYYCAHARIPRTLTACVGWNLSIYCRMWTKGCSDREDSKGHGNVSCSIEDVVTWATEYIVYDDATGGGREDSAPRQPVAFGIP